MVDQVRLPEEVEKGASGGPSFSTQILDGMGGVEQRNIQWTRRRGKWNVAYGIQRLNDPTGAIRKVIALHHTQMGRAYAFLFKDWADYSVTDGVIGTGDGVETDFQLVKIYDNGGGRTFSRKITQPKADTLTVEVDGTPTTSWTLLSSGVLQFATAPASSKVITASFEFFVPVRFDNDDLTVAVQTFNAGSIPQIIVREVIE